MIITVNQELQEYPEIDKWLKEQQLTRKDIAYISGLKKTYPEDSETYIKTGVLDFKCLVLIEQAIDQIDRINKVIGKINDNK
jgi:uncharacterized protein YllA (UPF0747 family)